jgi:heme oxygenase
MCVVPSLHDQLRAATRTAHERVEALVGLPRTLTQHVRTLEAFYGFVEPWERQLADVIVPLASALGDRLKAHLLYEDLRALGLSEDDVAALPRCASLPDVRTIPAALGSMYVLEGATLGGQVLAAHVQAHLGLADGRGYRFYLSYGPRVAEMWRNFLRVLGTAVSQDGADASLTVTSAVETFTALERWFRTQLL